MAARSIAEIIGSLDAKTYHVDLRGPDRGEEDIRLLASTPALSYVRSIDLSGTVLSVASVRALASSPYLTQLGVLEIGFYDLAPEALAALLAPAWLRELKSLRVKAPQDVWLRALELMAATPPTRRLTHVTISFRHDDVAMPGLLAIVGSPHFASVVSLELEANSSLGVEGARELGEAPNVAGLRELKITWGNLGGAGLAALASSRLLSGLRVLCVPENKFTPDGVLALARSTHLTNLEELDLTRNDEIYDDAVAALVTSPNARSLKRLRLMQTGIGSKAAKAILASPYLGAIEELTLRGNDIKKDGVDWVDQGAVIGRSKADPEAKALLARFGSRVDL